MPDLAFRIWQAALALLVGLIVLSHYCDMKCALHLATTCGCAR